ncbi:MAG TPA: hypothetical protein GX503_04950 [Clostridiales bacterium]|nr:hypothetical protein [Clostridiales bacterium]
MEYGELDKKSKKRCAFLEVFLNEQVDRRDYESGGRMESKEGRRNQCRWKLFQMRY